MSVKMDDSDGSQAALAVTGLRRSGWYYVTGFSSLIYLSDL
jgi:hypothetical protein